MRAYLSVLEADRAEGARLAFVTACEAAGTTAIAEENAILSAGDEFLPSCALAVRRGAEPTAEYWDWLRAQTEQAQAEHDAWVAAGHEWHQGKEG